MASASSFVPSADHPFITFDDRPTADDKLGQRTWMLLGEAFSKCQHLARAPINPHLSQRMIRVYLASGTQATTAIEGNTLSIEDVQRIIDKGTADVGPSRAYQEQEVRNILDAVDEIRVALLQGHRIPITTSRLRALNAKVLEAVPIEPYVTPGEFREPGVDVRVGRAYQPPPGREVAALTKQFDDWLRRIRLSPKDESTASDETKFVVAVVAAILAHLYIAWIHPFGDGNGRTARLIETQILAESGIVPIVSTQLLSNHFNLTRDDYYRALNEARRGPDHFVRYALQGFVDQLREQIRQVQDQNMHLVWQAYVHETFELNHERHTEAHTRQQRLAMILPEEAHRALPADKVMDLSTDLARAYAVTGPRTPARDLNMLVKLGLAVRTGSSSKPRYYANREILQRFLPPVSS
jgi:Fic family protein